MKNILIPALAAAALLASCSEWTEVENKNYLPQIRQDDPAYLAALRDFKADESGHKVVMMTVQGISATPNRQNQHPMAMPDSVDFLVLTNGTELHLNLVKELNEVRLRKGTKTLVLIDYEQMRKEWVEAKNEVLGSEAEEEYTDEKYLVYCKGFTQKTLAACDEYGFDGVVVSYTTLPSDDIPKGKETFLSYIEAWEQSHPQAILAFRMSYIPNLLKPAETLREKMLRMFRDSEFLILVPDEQQNTASALTIWMRNNLRDVQSLLGKPFPADKFPLDRFIVEASVPAIEDGTLVGPAIQTVAQWALEPANETQIPNYNKAGLYITNAQDDYFNAVTFQQIRKAIGTLNAHHKNENSDDNESKL